MSGQNGHGRLSREEFVDVLDAAREPLATIVDADGRVLVDPPQLPITQPTPATPPRPKLPVSSSAQVGEIRSEGAAVAAAVGSDHVQKRVALQRLHSEALAKLALLRNRLQDATSRLADLERKREEFVASLPRRIRRRLGQRPSRIVQATPWVAATADTLLIANAYGLFGSVALPVPASSYLSNGVELLRAAAVSFAFAFGLRMVGGRVRDLAEEARERSDGYGMAGDALVALSVLVGAVLLGFSAAKLQAVFLGLMLGGSSATVPVSVLASIVVFLGSVSFASGYFSTEREVTTVASLDKAISSGRSSLEEIREAFSVQRGEVRALRKELHGLEEQKQLDLVEQAAHTERVVYAHVGGDINRYGLELTADAAKVPGAP